MDEGIRLFDELLMENYGHAWYPYIHAVMQNRDGIAENVKRVSKQISDKLNLLPSFRFYAALGAVNLVGGEVSRELGLHDYSLERLHEFYMDTISNIRQNNITEERGPCHLCLTTCLSICPSTPWLLTAPPMHGPRL